MEYGKDWHYTDQQHETKISAQEYIAELKKEIETLKDREAHWRYLNDCWTRLYYHERALRTGGQVVGSIGRDVSRVRQAQRVLEIIELAK